MGEILVLKPAHLRDKFGSDPYENPVATRELFPVSNRIFKASRHVLEDYLEQYLAENLLDSIEQSQLTHLMELVRRLQISLAVAMRKGSTTSPFPSMEYIEAEAIRAALDFHRGNVSMCAKALGIGRNTLYRKMKEYKTKSK